ncbi:MAG TPA: hypothetical protein VME20_04335 [Acidimicrobiales bacterium]|nr:hypothetical protein [Acidimicrobiales bacterium]
MLVLGSLLALLSGMFNAAAAALEKKEGMRTAPGRRGLRLLIALARRPLWALAILLSVFGWICEAASLATAPVPVVATLRNAGRGVLVVGGGRWLGERFSRLELLGVILASAGAAITAVGAAHTSVVRTPLSNLAVLAVAAVCAGAAVVVSAVSSWWARGAPAGDVAATQRRLKASGAGTGTAVGLVYAATGVFTKEVGDRFALYGGGGLPAVLASASPWLMTALAIWAQSLIQQAFRRANAATVSAANASVASLGLIGAGFVLYHEALPRGADAWLLLGGVVVALVGTALLIGARPTVPSGAPGPPSTAEDRPRPGEGTPKAGGLLPR